MFFKRQMSRYVLRLPFFSVSTILIISQSAIDTPISNLVPRGFAPYCSCWLDETLVSRPLVKRNEDARYEGVVTLTRVTCLNGQ